jgi:hypothetical protein
MILFSIAMHIYLSPLLLRTETARRVEIEKSVQANHPRIMILGVHFVPPLIIVESFLVPVLSTMVITRPYSPQWTSQPLPDVLERLQSLVLDLSF